MSNQTEYRDVTNGNRRVKKTGALLTAASGIVVLLAGSSARGQDAPAAPAAPTTRPSMITSGIDADGGLHLTSGKSTIINFRRMYKTVSIGSPEIADCNQISATSLLVTAKKPGTTALVVLDDESHSVVIDVVVDPDLALLQRTLKDQFPGLDVTVTPLNDTLALHGRVPSMRVAEQIVEVAGTYGKVHNFLEISGGQQVMLKVRLAEVSKSALRNLGVTFGGTDGISSFTTASVANGANTFNIPAAAGSPLYTASLGATNLFGQGKFGATSFDYFITALRTNNLLRDLAEPNLLTSSGVEASFLAGGQIPIPVPQPGNGGSTITIQYVQYGVQLKFTPDVLGNGRIKLKVTPDVSQLDYGHAISINGLSVPGFTERKLETTVELADGQSLALAGLLQNDVSASSSVIPVLGDLPIIGPLFRSTSFSRDETELVVMVTPRLQAPLNPDQVPLLPGEHWRYPTEAEQFFFKDLGGPAVEPGKARADTKSAGPAPEFHGTYGFTTAGTGGVAPVDAAPAPVK